MAKRRRDLFAGIEGDCEVMGLNLPEIKVPRINLMARCEGFFTYGG